MAPSCVYKGYSAVVMAMGEPHDKQLSTTLPQREHLFLHRLKNVSVCSQLESNLQMKIN